MADKAAEKPTGQPAAGEVQARQELANAEELGNEESARAARKRLDALGVAGVAEAAKQRQAAEDDDQDGKRDRAPQGRRAPGKQQA